MGSGSANTKAGFVMGTGAAIEVPVGFTPKFVKCVRVRDTGETAYEAMMEHIASMPAASGVKVTNDDGTKAAAMVTVTTGGITINDDPAGTFTIGADADLNVDGIGIYWFAAE